MAGTQNFFALLGDDEGEDFQALATKIVGPPAAPAAKPAPKPAAPAPAVKTPFKPSLSGAPTPTPTPDPAVSSAPRGRGGARGGRGDRGAYRPHGNRFSGGEFSEAGAALEKPANGVANGEAGRGGYGGRGRGPGRGRGYYGNKGEGGDERRPRREFERHSGTGRGNEIKRHGAGAANWGVEGEVLPTDLPAAEVEAEKVEAEATEEVKAEAGKTEAEAESPAEEKKEAEEVKEEEEDKEMTLKEYEALREEKRKALLAKKAAEGRKVEEAAFDSMTKVTKPAEEELVLYKLGSDKPYKKKAEDEEERELKPKTVNINEFLKPADGESYFPPRRGGRGGGRGDRRGGRGGRGGFGGPRSSAGSQIDTNDTAQFPSLGK